MRGSLGSWSPGNVVGSWTDPQGAGPFQGRHYAGLSGLLEPGQRSRTPRRCPQCHGPFQAHDRGPKGPSYVCMESRASSGRGGIVGAALEGRTSLRSLEKTRDGLAGIEARKALPVCVFSAFVFPGCKQPGNRGRSKLRPSTYA